MINKRKLKKAISRIKNLPKNHNLIFYIFNKIKMNYLMKFNKSTKVSFPSNIMIELNNHCNLHCTTCPREYKFGKEMDKGFMDFEMVKNIIDQTWVYLDSVGLTGMGETFYYKDIEKVVDYIKNKNKGIIISLSTNAVLPDFLEKVKRVVNKVDTIQVSVDGIDEIYNKIRLNSNFELFKNNLKSLIYLTKNTTTNLMLNMVVTKENYSQMHTMVKFANEVNVKFLNFTPINLVSITNCNKEYYQFFKQDDFINELKKLDETKNKFSEIEVTKWDFSVAPGFKKCPFPWNQFYITWDGFVVPCCGKPFPKEKNFGNIKSSELIDILNSSEFQLFREKWYINQTQAFCEKCHFLEI